ncbi:MAG: SGNH/GDSL hydrolase family protein [Planctomycetes bacterium]|nr:SGNH/GDSL hydrolase family protein [Planctomycetota bacterium]
MYRLILLVFVLAVFGFAAVGRLLLAPDAWWNWSALVLVAAGLASCSVGIKRLKLKREPKWYSLRPGMLAGCALLLLTAWFVARVPAPMGEGPAGEAVDATAFDQIWSERPIVLLSVGDSVSTGYGAPEGHGYFHLIRENADDTYPEMRGLDLAHVLPNIRVVRKAFNSTNSIQHLRDIQSLPSYPADTFGIVCITTGGIDLIHQYGKAAPVEGAMYGASWDVAEPWIENFRERLDTMVDTLAQKFPGGCAVMLATIYEPTDGVGDIENAGPLFWMPAWPDGKRIHTAFNDALIACADAHAYVHTVDVYETMLGHGIHCRDEENEHYVSDDPNYWFFYNLEDPNQRGYDAIRRVFLNAIIGALRFEPGFDVPPDLSQ